MLCNIDQTCVLLLCHLLFLVCTCLLIVKSALNCDVHEDYPHACTSLLCLQDLREFLALERP